MLVAKLKTISLGIMISCPCLLSATTVIVIITPHGIVVSSDSKMVKSTGDRLRVGEGATDKFVIIQDRVVVANVGHSEMWDSHCPECGYHFVKWMKHLESRLPKDITVEQLSSVIHDESSNLFATFDQAMKRGVFTSRDPAEFYESFIDYLIVGYQSGGPRIYNNDLYIDWNQRRLVVLQPFLRDSDEIIGRGSYRLYGFGFKEAIADYENRQSYAYKEAMIRAPKAFGDWIGERDVPINEAISLSRVLIKIEEETNPGDVGGDIQTAIILPDGRASKIAPYKGLQTTESTGNGRR